MGSRRFGMSPYQWWSSGSGTLSSKSARLPADELKPSRSQFWAERYNQGLFPSGIPYLYLDHCC
ncbi:MAG: hypothetical protein P3X23_001745 [Thermosynechococcus sp. Uc]|uniref:hypothetical protein n=1 Tax=Thermosynechococcus sp. Uc TaxID=3034853 RepID=UPI001A00F9EB|nr:hypothetical protein [Thermosynechococcus sp. Uc]MDM7325828.1 hypothetical protein [Thermosynechococcus sp. Uc]HIK26043.1 hypothetical protein [Thermosynechococcus sp. M46_R2017_013]